MSDTVKGHVGTLDDMGRRFVDAWHRAERGEAVAETHITFHDLPALLSALTPERLDLLRYVRHIVTTGCHPAMRDRTLTADSPGSPRAG